MNGGSCVCGDGTFQTGSDPLSCTLCHADCKRCNGTESNECTQCWEDNSHLDNGSCECDDGYWESNVDPVACS